MRKLLACCLLALAVTVSAQNKTFVEALAGLQAASTPLGKDATFRSPSLVRDMKYGILLPRAYPTAARRFPVPYLLHGLSGNYLDWDTKTSLERYAENMPIIVVMPDADASW